MTALMPWETVSASKVSSRQLERLVVIYIRQSSMQQVLDHQESTRLQYALVDRAVALGWVADRVLVIDEDLGKSGASAVARSGFQRLVSEIGLDHVGLVLGIEMPRLARSGRDWYQLMELCAISGALLGDADGLYDPADYNDRLLLGLKGTMAEAELHLIKQRMQAGRLNKARRGELSVPLPIGYVRRPSGEAVLDPDEQVQAVVRLVFSKFAEFTTTHALLRCLVDHGIELGVRLRSGPDKGELEWRRPNRMTLQIMLHSPVYAGIYAYGRRRVDARRQQPGRPSTGRVVRGEQEWLVFIPGMLPAYISEETWRANLAQLAADASRSDARGSARAGSALLSGLARCGRCGKRMAVQYHTREKGTVPEYRCSRQVGDYGAARPCQSLAGACADAFVSAQILDALSPAALEVSLRAAEQVEADRTALEEIWAKRLERAAIAVDRARRCYRLAEAENRLVVRQLEKDWEQALADQQRLSEEHDRFVRTRPTCLTPAERAAITALASDIEGLWHAPTTTDKDRKELIRALITDVRLTVQGESERVAVTRTWAGGHTTEDILVRPVARIDQLSNYPQLAARVRALDAQGLTSRQIAARLDAEGFRPPKRIEHFTPNSITTLRRRLRTGARACPAPGRDGLGEHEWRLSDLAHHLDMPEATLYTWIQRGWVASRRDEAPHRLVLIADDAALAELRERRSRPHGYYSRLRWTTPDPLATVPGDDQTASPNL
ncbi:MAG TPA: recombinase family protein [Pseudonocardiaceae bacterium]|nr:recombinase family protein [Pseudonocardiaceae bacterium]